MDRYIALDEAREAVRDRGVAYGKPVDSFNKLAKLWSAYKGTEFTVHDVGIMLMMLKMARLMNDETHEDSWVDIAGYAAVTCEAITDNQGNQHLPVGPQNIVTMSKD